MRSPKLSFFFFLIMIVALLLIIVVVTISNDRIKKIERKAETPLKTHPSSSLN